jgi:hypothetical protein
VIAPAGEMPIVSNATASAMGAKILRKSIPPSFG